MIYRVLYIILNLFSVLFLPFYISLTLIFLGVILFKNYYEGLVLIIFYEGLYITSGNGFLDTPLVLSMILGILLLSRDYFRKKINFLSNDY